MDRDFSFSKKERLTERRTIKALFECETSFAHYPFRVYYMVGDDHSDQPLRAAVSVSKRIYKRAVDRNRLKRLTREAWRMNKGRLHSAMVQRNTSLVLMLVYTSAEMHDFSFISNKTREVVSKLLLILPGEDAAAPV